MSSKGILRTGFCAFSLSLSLLAGCASPVVPTPATGGDVPAPAAQAPGETPAAQPAPAAPAPAALTPVTLAGQASFRGEALSGYDVTVLDAQTGKAVERKADLAGVTTLAVLDKNLKTDASGAFSFQVVGLKPGQALRVQIRQGNGLLETIVTSDLQALGAKKLQLLQATGNGLSINELTTAIAKIARGVLTTTQVLTPEAAAPVLAQLATEMAALSVKLDAALKSNPNLANNLVSTQSKESEAVNSLVSTAGALKEVTQAVAKLVSQVAKSSATNAAPAASDPAVMAQLATVQFIGTVLTGSFANNNFSLSNSATGQKVDAASGDVGSVSSNVTGSGSSSSSGASLTTEQQAILNNIAAADHSDVSTADQQAVLTILSNHKSDLGLSSTDWTLLTQMNDYVIPNPAPAFALNSGRQQSVAKYLLERIFQRKTGGTAPYTSLSAIQTDFSYAVNKEVTKWRLISAVKAATTDGAVVTALNTYADDMRTDFTNYLTWHEDWNVPTDAGTWAGNWKGQENYFAQNIANLAAFKANTAFQAAIGTRIRATANVGQSDMAILDGLAQGLITNVGFTSTTSDTDILNLLKANKTWVGLDSADWDQLLKLSVYDRTGSGGEDFTNSGRQKAVAQYLRERVFNRTTPAITPFPYMSTTTLKADFHYAVEKEAAKWNLIIDIAAAKADSNNTTKAITALDTYLPTIKTDFNQYLGWHGDWTVPNPAAWANGWAGEANYFAQNLANITSYEGTTDKTAIATRVLHASTGFSDMAILYGLRPVSATYRVNR